jgi:hypothetical protein
MTELLDFAAELIELEGGAVERSADGVSALLPGPLARDWSVAEELLLSDAAGAAQQLAYGSELLEQMLATATRGVSVAAVNLEQPAPRASLIKAAAERWTLRNGLVSVGDIRVCLTARLQLFALATLHGDERREMVVSSVLSTRSGTEVDGFEEAIVGVSAAGDSPLPNLPEALLAAGLRACERRALVQAASFRDGMTRRFERDRERIEVYFEDLVRELDKRARKGKLDPAVIADKRRALFADRAAKLEALAARFVLRIELAPIALRTLEVESGFASITLRRRKASRTLELEYDGATRRMVAPRCDGCGGSAVKPAACDDALHLLCEACAPRAEGRLTCAACKAPGRGQAAEPLGDRIHPTA